MRRVTPADLKHTPSAYSESHGCDQIANAMALHTAIVALICSVRRVFWCIENPCSSFLFHLPCMYDVICSCGATSVTAWHGRSRLKSGLDECRRAVHSSPCWAIQIHVPVLLLRYARTSDCRSGLALHVVDLGWVQAARVADDAIRR